MDCVEAAKAIRKELKAKFPSVKFSVRSSRYSGGSSVYVQWSDFPCTDTVNSIISKYERVSRCEYTGEILSGGNMYISSSHNWTDETTAKINEVVNSKNYSDDILNDYYWKNQIFNEAAKELEKEWLKENEVKDNNKPNNSKQETAPTKQADKVELKINEKLNGIELIFNGSITQNTSKLLKENGFRFSYKQKKWYTKQTKERLTFAESFVLSFNDVLEEVQEEAPTNEQEQTTPEKPMTANEKDHGKNDKITVKEITFLWSESNQIEDNKTVTTFQQANELIKHAARQAPDNGAYDKTKFIITWSDGFQYTGRIDIVYSDIFKHEPLKDHIEGHCLFYAGKKKPSHMSQQDYDNYLNMYSENKQEYIDFLNTYMLEDQEKTASIVNHNNVIDITDRIKQRKEQQQKQEALDKLTNDIIPLLKSHEIEKLQALAFQKNEKAFAEYLQQLELITALRKEK